MNEYPLTSLVTLALVLLGVLLANRVSSARLEFSQSDQPSVTQHSIEIYSDPKFMIVFRNQMNLLRAFNSFSTDSLDFCFRLIRRFSCSCWAWLFYRQGLIRQKLPHSHKVGYTLAWLSMLVLMIGAFASSIYQPVI